LRLPSRCGRTLLRPRPEGAIRIGAPRRSHRAAPPSPQRGSRVRSPRAPERSATHGTGGLNPPPKVHRAFSRAASLRVGGIQFARRVPAAMSPEAAGYRAGVPRWGVAGVVSYEQRGAPPWDVPARSQPEESWGATSGGEQATSGRAPAGQNRGRYAVPKKKPAPGPQGNRKDRRG
jgi:hypothetical protein